MFKKIVVAILALVVVSLPVYAETNFDTGELERAFPYDLGDFSNFTPHNADVGSGAEKLLDSALEIFRSYIKSAVGSGFLMLAACAIVSIASGFAKDAGIKVPQKAVDIVIVCALVGICLTSASSVINETRDSIENLDTFTKILIPVFAASSAIAGKPVSAISSAGTTLIFSEIIIWLALNVFIPFLYVYIVAVAAGAMSDNELLNRVAKLIKSISTTVFRGFLMIFTGYLTLSNVVTGTTDAVAVKTAQAAISGAVPVVGSIIANASDALLSGASILKSTIGVFGFIGVCLICLAPFIKCLINLLVFKVLAAFSSSFASGAASKMLDGIGEAYSIALGLLGTCCAVVFISIVVSMVVTAT